MVAPFLFMLLGGGFTLGMSLSNSIQASNVIRNANVLMTRKIDLSRPENQQMLIRSAAGLGFNIPGTNTPNPSGKGAIILTKVIRVGPVQCSLGIPGWNGMPASCPNHGVYVIAQRIGMGNTGRWSSAVGNPGTAVASDGELADSDIANSSSNRAVGFPSTPAGAGIVYLEIDQFTYVGELFADFSSLTILPQFMSAPNLSIRNIS